MSTVELGKAKRLPFVPLVKRMEAIEAAIPIAIVDTSDLIKFMVSIIAAEEILKSRKKLNEILHETTGQPIEKILKDTERDNYLTAQEAKDYGLIDEIMTNMK